MPPPRASARMCSCRAISRSRSCSPPPWYGTTLVSAQHLRRRQPPLYPALGDPRVGVRQRVTLRLLRGGLEDARHQTVEQLGWSLPDHVVCPIASGSLFTKLGRVPPSGGAGARRRRASSSNGAQATGCDPVAEAFDAGNETCVPRQDPDTIAKSLAIGNPTDGPYALELARSSGGGIDSVTRRGDPRGHRAARRDHRRVHRDCGRRRPRVLAKLAERGDISPDERVVVYITGEGLKTLEATASCSRCTRSSPRSRVSTRRRRDRSAAAAGSAS